MTSLFFLLEISFIDYKAIPQVTGKGLLFKDAVNSSLPMNNNKLCSPQINSATFQLIHTFHFIATHPSKPSQF